ncbi:MAG: polyphosphate kinase 2 family protein [bacterium]|jgi:PPK2 family polyphosphate:nucleotide phosphotransferase|nr:polyphosphate kinase 2 family protein [bacterium]
MALVDGEPPGEERHRITRLLEPLRVEPGSRVELPRDFDPGYTGGYARKRHAGRDLARGISELAAYQDRLAAQRTHAVLLILQALDAAGKDGTIKHVMSGVNPQGVSVHSFGPPSAEELRQHFLWRYANRLPARGTIGIFNRSHYEEVLVVRVHPELLDRQGLPVEARSGHLWDRRFRAINEWERSLVENGVHLVKLFLNLSREEQRRRFLDRIETPQKNWKFSSADARERAFWDDYQRVYAEMLSRTSTEWAPWHVIPADHKWFARLAAAGALEHELMRIDPRYPEVPEAELAELRRARAELEMEAG